MKLTQAQIQELYSFTRMHYVEHYELQTELVDHLANGIVALQEKTPDLSFNDALKREFEKFGVGGFKKVVRKQQRAMEWRYFKIVIQFYRTYFKLPKIVLTVFSILGLYSAVLLIHVDFRYNVILALLFTIVAITFFISFKNRKNNDLECVKHGKKWMLKDQIYNYGQIANGIIIFPIVLNMPYIREIIPISNSFVALAFAALITCLSLLSYVTIVVIPKKADELLVETYPEYKMA